jgi:hypothetical protein
MQLQSECGRMPTTRIDVGGASEPEIHIIGQIRQLLGRGKLECFLVAPIYV